MRSVVRQGRHLDRWLDFKSHQIFDDVITYTALQFYTREPREKVRFAVAPDGEMVDVDWSDADLNVPYTAIPETDEWLIATGAERALIDRLARDCLRLDDPSLTAAIFQGLITSADHIYHLERLGADYYKATPQGKGAVPYEVEIEDSIMKPLVSGPEAKRYENSETNTYLLFPYERDLHGTMRLITANDMAHRSPKAWAHLLRWERELRRREANAFNDENWYRFGRNQSIDKQDAPKLIIPRLVQHLKCSFDPQGLFGLDNVDVGGVLPAPQIDPNYLMAALNAPTCDYIFRIRSKPFLSNYRSANKQFIAILPIPDGSAVTRRLVSIAARQLQHRWTRRRDLLKQAADRLSVLARARHPARWLWPDLPDLPDLTERAPGGLRLATDRRKWAEDRLDEMEVARHEALRAALNRGGRCEGRFERGELRLYASGAVVLGKIYLDESAGRLIEAYWRWVFLSGPARDTERLASDLRRPPAVCGAPAAAQFISLVAALTDEVAAIEAEERALNDMLYDLYRLSSDERNLVENGSRRRSLAMIGR